MERRLRWWGSVRALCATQCIRRLRPALVGLLFLILLSYSAATLAAATTVGKASTSRATRESSIRDLPLEHLTPEARERITAVVSRPSMFRRMPVNVVECEPELYRYLIRHPEIVVNIWQLMGITKVNIERQGPYTFDATDGVGTVTRAELVYGTSDTHLIYCEGSYEGPLFPNRLTGRCVLLLKSGYHEEPNNRWQITNRMDVFLQVDHVAVDAITRTLHPLFGKSADVNFVESTKFLERICRTSEENGPGMQRLAKRLDHVEPDVRSRFSDLTSAVHQNAQQRLAAATVPDGTPVRDGPSSTPAASAAQRR